MGIILIEEGVVLYYFSNDVLKTKYNYEYAIYRKLKNACGYINSNTNDFNYILDSLNRIESYSNRYGKIFYIDNDFYDNYYRPGIVGDYYKVLYRKVNDWQELSQYDINHI